MDECLSGSFTLEEVQKVCVELNKVLSSAGFPLRKLLSNVPDVLNGAEADDKHPNLSVYSSAKTLGLL